MLFKTLFNNPANFQIPPAPIKVIMADDHPLSTKGISAVLNENPCIMLCGSFLNGKELLDWYTGSNADVILLVIHMPILNGMEAGKQLLTRFPVARIIILSIDDDQKVMRLMYDMGICAYLPKNANPEDLIQTIIKVHAGEKVFHENLSASLSAIAINKRNALVSKFSAREIQVLKLIVKGQTNPQIAAELNLSPLTIKTHRQNLLHKAAASNTAQLIAEVNLMEFL